MEWKEEGKNIQNMGMRESEMEWIHDFHQIMQIVGIQFFTLILLKCVFYTADCYHEFFENK
jgi:hypothetical protein